jgi:hypothetical protein
MFRNVPTNTYQRIFIDVARESDVPLCVAGQRVKVVSPVALLLHR